MRVKKMAARITVELFGLLLSLIIVIPFFFVVINSFKTKNEAGDMLLSLPTQYKILENYATVFKEGKILSAFLNSSIITLFSVIFIVFFSSMAGFVLQRKRSRFSNIVDFFVISGLIVPPSIVPLYWVLKFLNIQTTFLGVILVYIALGFSFSTILYKGFFKTVPRELDEAAIIDGCGCFRMFSTIILPLLKPVTVTVFITQFMSVWNDFTIVLYFLSNPNRFTLPLTVYFFFGQYSSSWNLVFADVIVIVFPVVLIYFFAQRHIVSGMTSGALKG